MDQGDWNELFFARCTAVLAKIERRLTTVQIEYLRRYYTVNKYPEAAEIREIAGQWNIDDFRFYLNLEEWFFGQRMAEREAQQRRDKAQRAAA